MFDVGFWELAVIATIMLVVLGPERLPGVARTAGFWLSKVRRMVGDVKAEVKKEMDAAELKELDDAKNQIQQATKTVQTHLNKDILKDDNETATAKEKTDSDKFPSTTKVTDESEKS